MPLEQQENQAIQAALAGDWEKAISLNQEILKADPQNIPALNRLTWAYIQSGKLAQAKKICQKASSIDPYNQIVIRNKRLMDNLKPADVKKLRCKKAKSESHVLFLEDPGKTKVVKLVRLASPQVIFRQRPSDKVLLIPKKHTIAIHSLDGDYLGSLPDDISLRLIRFIKGGNCYEAVIKSVESNNLEVFIRETKRGKKYCNIQSFICTSTQNQFFFDQENPDNSPIEPETTEESGAQGA